MRFVPAVLTLLLLAACAGQNPAPQSNPATVCPTDPMGLARTIAEGPAWAAHREEFVFGARPVGNVAWTMPTIDTSAAFALFLAQVLALPGDQRMLHGGRVAYWHGLTGTMVVIEPASASCGIALRPRGGKGAYLDLR